MVKFLAILWPYTPGSKANCSTADCQPVQLLGLLKKRETHANSDKQHNASEVGFGHSVEEVTALDRSAKLGNSLALQIRGWQLSLASFTFLCLPSCLCYLVLDCETCSSPNLETRPSVIFLAFVTWFVVVMSPFFQSHHVSTILRTIIYFHTLSII